jgi:hypothetical protein
MNQEAYANVVNMAALKKFGIDYKLSEPTKTVQTQPQPPVTIVDAIMGSGKTSWSIQYMNEASEDIRFLFVTPYLDEVDVILNKVKERNFKQPLQTNTNKRGNLKKLLEAGFDVATTHELFKLMDTETLELIREKGYVLMLDETIDIMENLSLAQDEFQLLKYAGMLLHDEETDSLTWNDACTFQDVPRFEDIKESAASGSLFYYSDTTLFKTLPIDLFLPFQEVYLLTYMFKHSEMRYYFDIHNIQYQYKAVVDAGGVFSLIPHEDKEPYDKTKIRELINIYEGKLNDVGEQKYELSFGWYNRQSNKDTIERIRKNTVTYFKNNTKTTVKQNLWTCYNKDISKLKGVGFAKEHLPFNVRATNEYKEKSSLAYLINRFISPAKKNFFIAKCNNVDEDMVALSSLVQWIWRSRIREDKPINLYIPSKRMRNLLKDWLNNPDL